MIAPTRLHQTGNGSVSTGNGIEFFPVNHANTFQGRASTMASTYREYDVALRNSIENARLMRNDSSIMECLEARQRAVALLKWHIEPEDDRSLEQKQLAEEMTKVMMRTPRFMEMRRVLQEAVWYGKSAVQVMYNTDWIGGYRRFCILSPDRDTPAWLPIHGDKLVFRHDDLTEFDRSKGRYPFQVGIRVGGSFQPGQKVRGKYEVEPVASQFRGTEAVDRGMAYFVDQEDRQKLIIHKHSIEDGAYEDILSAGSIHGVGVRSRIYWDWIQKQEIQSMLLAYIERYHGGIEIYRFPLGNDEAEKSVDAAIRNRQPGRAALKVPIPMGEDAMQYGVEVFESSMAGVQQMQDLLTNFYGHRIKRYILGQILSSESEATGLGSGVADLHLESLLQIIEYDATGLEETITEEPLRRLQHSNFPSSRGIRLRFKIDTREADSDSKLDAVRQAWEMGARIKESDVLDQCGLSAPTASDRVLPAPGGGQGQQPPGMPGMPPSGPPKVQASVPDHVTANPEPEPAKYSYAAQEPDLRSAIERAAAETDQEPTEAQKLAGNYRKGQFHWNGWTIAIETPAGGFRRGKNSLGVEWSHQIPVHYGYIRRTESEADGDALDVFIGPEPESPVVFVVDQVKESGRFDEHKVMIGFRSEQDAAEAYRASYSKGWRGLKSITAMTVNQFRAWVEEGNSGSPIEEQVSRYSQKSFEWNEAKHPRDEGGRFSKKKAAESGKSYNDWSSSISDAFRSGDINEDHPAWKALSSEAAKPGSVDDFRDYKNLKGQHVRTSNGHHGVVVDAADDLSHVVVEHEDGGRSKHFLEGLDHLGARIMHDLGRGRPSERDMNYMAGVIAKEMQASGQPVGEAMKAHGLEGVSVTMPMRKLIAEKLAEAKSGDGATAKPKKPEPSAAHKAVASRFGIPPEAVQDIASTDVKELRRRDEYTPPNYAGDGPVTDYEDHPLGTARIMSFGDPNEAYVDFMHEFDPKDLTPTEHEDGVKQRDKSYPKYVEWAKAGHKPPPISAAVSEKTGKYLSMNRRRVLAAQDAGVKSIKGWLGVNNKETGNPLKYGDVMRALKEHEQKSAKPEPAPAKPSKAPGVAGIQQGLFGQDTSGQKSLFNVAKPSAKKPVAKEVAAKIAGKLGELLSKKDTVSPADLTIPLQPESLPGQKSMFSMGADQYEKRWITLGAKGGEHRTRVQIDDDGRITAGPASLKGETLKSLKSRSSEIRAKAAHARASGKGGRDFTAKQAAALAGNHRVLQYDAAKQAARLAGVAVHDVIKAMPEAYRFIKEQAELKERAKDRARILTGLNAGVLAQIENSHRDYSSVPGFDEAAHAVAMEHPELGLDPDDTDTPAAVWDLIREGKQDPPAMHSPEVAKLAAQWVKPAKKVKAHDDWDAVPFSRASRLDAPERYSVKWNESEHPRDATGKWSEKGNGSVSHQFKIDSDARKKWLDTGTAAAFRVQDSRYPLPEKSKSTWNGDDSETMPGVSGYANLINAWQDIMLGRTESATGDNYSSQVEQSGGTPSLVVMQGREIDGPGAEIIVPNPKIAAVFHKKDLEKSFRDFIGQEYGSLDEHDYRTAPIEEILNSYEWSEDDFENAVKHLLAEQSR